MVLPSTTHQRLAQRPLLDQGFRGLVQWMTMTIRFVRREICVLKMKK